MSDPSPVTRLRDVGTVTLQRRWNIETDRDELYVSQADPRALIASELAEHAVAGIGAPEIVHSFEPSGASLITINAVNRKLIYRVVEYVPEQRCYLMEWPD